jgi:hypothetical protein
LCGDRKWFDQNKQAFREGLLLFPRQKIRRKEKTSGIKDENHKTHKKSAHTAAKVQRQYGNLYSTS